MSARVSLGKPASYGDFVVERRVQLIDAMGGLRGKRLLDLGCGNGAQTVRLLDRFESTVGLDVVREHLDVLRTHVPPGVHCRAVWYDGGRIPFDDASFDAVLSIETLEHVEDEMRTLSEMFRVLEPGGVLVVSVPNQWWVIETHGATPPLL